MEETRKIDTKGGELFVKLMEVFNQNQRDFFGLPCGPLHDPATIISLISEKAFKFEPMHVEIDCTDTKYLGKTRCTKDKPYNCDVAVEVNLDEYWSVVFESLRRCK